MGGNWKPCVKLPIRMSEPKMTALTGALMSKHTQPVRVTVQLGSRADDGEVMDATQSLLDEVQQTGPAFEMVRSSSTEHGSKDAGQFVSMTGQVLIALASGGALVAFINAAQAWLLRNSGKEVIIEVGGKKLQLRGATTEQVQEVITAFMSEHQ